MSSYYKPSDEKLDELKNLQNQLQETLSGKILSLEIYNKDEMCIFIEPENIKEVILKLKTSKKFSFEQFMDITAIDYPDKEKRFTVVYNLLSLTKNLRFRIKTELQVNQKLDSISDIYTSANWWEREIWDMYGIYFNNHPDMRRILTDYGFKGFPLRKDFPLSGFSEVFYDENKEKVVYKNIDLKKSYRAFESSNPWQDDFDRLFDKINNKA